jgi:HAD superfamily phosphatase (TIGR01668 family)
MCLLQPTYIYDGDITTVDLNRLKEDGIHGIILDLDSTLMAPRSGLIEQRVTLWIAQAEKDFKLAVVTNNKNKKYLENAANCLTMPLVGKAAKPSRKILFTVLQQLNVSPEQSVLIGDRPLTDILAGKRAGMRTCLVTPLSTMSEHPIIVYLRKLERLVIKR